MAEIGKLQKTEIAAEMKRAYLDYAMSVIVSRALPDVRDGLKPVHRRILFAMSEMGLGPTSKFLKSARIVGEVMGKYHPHGNMAIYDSLVRLAQDFSMRYPLINGQGNFGCFTRDTKVQLTDGRSISFGELVEEESNGKKHWTFAFNQGNKRIEIAEIKHPRITKKDAELIEVTLDNGEKIRCTPNHRFMLRTGEYRKAQNLKPGNSLMPLYLESFKGNDNNLKNYKQVYQPIESLWQFVHHLSDEWNINHFDDFSEITTKASYYNHKVVSVKSLNIREDVYDLTIDKWHNFALGAGIFVHNSMDGDPPAADRYTEAKLQAISMEMLLDIDKETVDFIANYDGSFKEPAFLPSLLPNLLLMGSEGIAVGMATKIPPHNLSEVIDGLSFLIDKVKITTEPSLHVSSEVTVDELLEFIKGPDFPTAGAIYDWNEIKNVYTTGRGRILIRGKAEIEEIGQGKSAIIITELPYQVNKALLVARIADLAKEKKIDGISDLRDESDRHGIRVVVELKRDATPKKVLNNLFKHTSLQTTFPANIVALVDGTPQTLNLKTILEEFLKHRYLVVKRRSEFELRQAKARLHILEGLKIAVENIDAVIKTIRESKTQEDAKENLMKKFKLSEIQATAILDMQLRRLAALERQKIEEEYQMVKETIAYLEDLLAHPAKILVVIKEELTKLREKYKDERRTKVYKGKVGEFSEEDLIPNEPTVITITDTGYIKRQSTMSFKTQHRGGKGIIGMTTKEEDNIADIKFAQTHDNLLFFTNKGKVYQIKAYEISESSRTSKGTAIVNLLNIEAGEKAEAFVAYGKNDKSTYVLLATRNGTIKKSKISEFENIRKSGILAIKLEQGDELVWSRLTSANDQVFLFTRNGKCIKFSEDQIRPMGRNTMGVRGILLGKDDEVIQMDIIGKGEKAFALTIMQNGYGKKTSTDQFPKQGRGGQGVKVAEVTAKTGKIAYTQIIPQSCKEVIITSQKGQIVKLDVNSIPPLSRATQGVILMRFSKQGDLVASATCIED